MRSPRVVLSVRMMMAVVAVVALGLWLYQECQDGLPPRFVARRVPTRMGMLHRGMEYQSVLATLGFDRHWLLGGVETTSSRHEPIYPDLRTESYEIQPGLALENMQPDDRSAHAYVHLHFHRDPGGRWLLVGAEYTDQKMREVRRIR